MDIETLIEGTSLIDDDSGEEYGFSALDQFYIAPCSTSLADVLGQMTEYTSEEETERIAGFLRSHADDILLNIAYNTCIEEGLTEIPEGLKDRLLSIFHRSCSENLYVGIALVEELSI